MIANEACVFARAPSLEKGEIAPLDLYWLSSSFTKMSFANVSPID
ncbi:hypothetical protein OHAE_3247 [Ochrobactrum soli]|uniref:Uncharacterized protein n=1 Tax=Ochrobactrum soli TaxID=2448455 RepID=A0A2P9HGS3_9HYPH|nr:hypothetical protein OHAE_3247 [[Ochrobactrum] soli]